MISIKDVMCPLSAQIKMLSRTQAGNTAGELKHSLASLNSYLYCLNSLLEFDSTVLPASRYHGSTRVENGMQPLLLRQLSLPLMKGFVLLRRKV